MKDYSDIGLNNNLLSNDSLSLRSNFTNSTEFDARFEGVSANKLNKGFFSSPINIGNAPNSAYARLDGNNINIIINDGTNDRIIIGSL